VIEVFEDSRLRIGAGFTLKCDLHVFIISQAKKRERLHPGFFGKTGFQDQASLKR
jgi:hypothetical protein